MSKESKQIRFLLISSPLVVVFMIFIMYVRFLYLRNVSEEHFKIQTECLVKINLTSIENYAAAIGIEHRKVFLAQVILETGWLKDSTMLSKNNIIGMHKAYRRPTTQLNIKDSTSSLGTYKSIEACIWDYKIWQHINMQDKIYDDAGYVDKVIATKYNASSTYKDRLLYIYNRLK